MKVLQFKCDNCRRRFEFDDFIEFCPFCGKGFNGSVSETLINRPGIDLAQAIDSIWGDKARIKREFSTAISICIYLVNTYADKYVSKTLPKQELSKYEKNYSIIKQSNNRKTLISRLDDFVGYLATIIDNLKEGIPEDTSHRLEKAVQDTDDMVKDLYDFLGLRYSPSSVDFFLDENYTAKVLYTRDQLENLYELVLIAFDKYKKCVEDNNMFAAFASTSNYGMLTDYWLRWMSRLPREDDEEQEEEVDARFDQVISYMESHNAEKYLGMLDEDFVPHVDTFWYGIEMLCEFIDHHIAINYNTKKFFIGDDRRSKLLRVIESKEFEVNEARLDYAIELKERFEERVEALGDIAFGS